MVYKIAQIKYTSCYAILYQKGKHIMYTGQGNKEQVSQDLKDGFLNYILITRLPTLVRTFKSVFGIHDILAGIPIVPYLNVAKCKA
jgi:hypothetical protein